MKLKRINTILMTGIILMLGGLVFTACSKEEQIEVINHDEQIEDIKLIEQMEVINLDEQLAEALSKTKDISDIEEPGSELVTIQAEKVMMGLDWGMTVEEVKNAMSGHENCYLIDDGYALLYWIKDFQGIEGANAILSFWFYEGELSDGGYDFSSAEGRKEYATSPELIAELNKAFRKSYQESSEAAAETPGLGVIFNQMLYYKGSDSFIQISSYLPEKMYISFEPVDSNTAQGMMEELGMNE